MPTRPIPLPRQYHLALHTAQHRTRLVMQEQARKLRQKLARLAKDKALTARQLLTAKNALKATEKAVWKDVARIIAMNNYDAAVAAVNLQALTPVVRQAVLDQLATAQAEYTASELDAVMVGVSETAAGWASSLWDRVSGMTGSDMIQAVTDWVDPSVTGGLSYAADRVTQDQMSNTFHDAQIETADVRGMTTVFWRLDDSHSVEDECDDYADQEYNVDEVPEIPHTGCLCWLEPGQQEDTMPYNPEVGGDQEQGPNAPTFDEMNQATIKGAVEVALSTAPDAIQGWAEHLRASAGSGATVRIMQAPHGGYTYHVFK